MAVLAASSLVGTASGTSMYAFYPGPNKGAQIGTQDPKTGDIWVNNCNANIDGAPLFPTSNPFVLKTNNQPKKGGSMAATGWWDSQKVVVSKKNMFSSSFFFWVWRSWRGREGEISSNIGALMTGSAHVTCNV